LRYYIQCKNPTCVLNIYINFEQFFPRNREEIRQQYPSGFVLECLNGHSNYYYASDVMAHPQYFAASASGAMLGAILYINHPVAGAIGLVGGGALARNTEEKNADFFNRSR
jgi:hypothetical protein